MVSFECLALTTPILEVSLKELTGAPYSLLKASTAWTWHARFTKSGCSCAFLQFACTVKIRHHSLIMVAVGVCGWARTRIVHNSVHRTLSKEDADSKQTSVRP